MNQEVLNQIERIKKKLVIAKDTDTEFEVFGASSHKYIVGETVSNAGILQFEKDYNVSLPESYKMFLMHIGNGGISYQNSAAGPSYGIFPFGEHIQELIYMNPENCLEKNCVIYPKMSDESSSELTRKIDENEDLSEEEFDEELGKMFAGILPIGSQGCSYYYGLVLNGEFKGRVVGVDLDRQKPYFVFESNFLDWYERWLDEITAESRTEDHDLFNYTLGGSVSHILKVYASTDDEEIKLECLSGILRKKKIDLEALAFLDKEFKTSNLEIQKRILQVLAKFDYNLARPHLIDFVKSDLLTVFQTVFWYAKDKSADWLDVIKENAVKINDDETFRFTTYLLKETGIDYGAFLIPFALHQNVEIRVQAYYSLGLLKNKTDYLDTFILGLNDEANRVVHITLQALEGVKNKKLLKHYKNIAERFPEEQDYILANLNHRLKAFGLTNKTIKKVQY
ncbi:MAG: SMI1/KNR4 family protein [Flavobacterium sp.]|uniref:SMI1/KNR4 family protein n=1 Tax=Flavobacterium sp. TaxID=239 RepID=UPI001AFE9B2D|nr:SMI1/KNR4 family protein [Flavobacterium sp.]MBO9585388.1 SMI1/KNR4 family protein [Flavobacterium sp.]